jgi:hypothetical protein
MQSSGTPLRHALPARGQIQVKASTQGQVSYQGNTSIVTVALTQLQLVIMMLCRFEREVLAGRLWHPPCQAANTDLPDALPDTFPSVGELCSETLFGL